MIGYHLSCEEHGPRPLAGFAQRAEQAGFRFAQISDHFHPWTNHQGESPFVWGVLGAIAERTEEIQVGTAVTCPTIRLHPAIIAHAAATAALQLDDRFFLGLGSGERLNETVLGDRWPPPSVRLEMLDEAVEIMRELWTGKMVTRHGRHYVVENARIFTRPDAPPPVIVSGFGAEATSLAARIGDGFMSTGAEQELLARYREEDGSGPAYSMIHVSVAGDRATALDVAKEWWPNSTIPGAAGQELSIPEHFEPIGRAMPDEAFERSFVLGDDPDDHAAALQEVLDAGFDHVAVHQVGPDQERFFRLYEEEVLPRVERATREPVGAHSRS